ncbi:MAG: hypothetical protein KBD76_04575 [Bacteriovorax sp.]|jgi:hypothetical protein|nr:hypothetical protein [Bacteriovorax sp.]
MEKSKFTDSKRFMVVRCRDSQAKDEEKRKSYPYQVKVKIERTDREGDTSIEYQYLHCKVKIEKPGEYEFYVNQGSMPNKEKPGELITWCKLEELRK